MENRFEGITALLPAFLPVEGDSRSGRLDRAIRSVLSQDSPLPLQLLLIDNGSPLPLNCHPRLSALLKREEVTYLRIERDHGLVFALNAGLRSARYDLVAQIGQEDFWRPRKLQRQVERFREDPDLTILGTSMEITYGDPRRNQVHVRGPGWQEILDFTSATGCPFPLGSILARKDVLTLLGGYPHDTRFRYCEDFALWSVWIRFFKCAILQDVLYEHGVSETEADAVYVATQRNGADLVRERFMAQRNQAALPSAMEHVARYLNWSLVKTGAVLFLAWRDYDSILVEPELYEPVQQILPDRRVHACQEAGNLLADRYFVLQRRGCAGLASPPHARCLHDADSLPGLESIR